MPAGIRNYVLESATNPGTGSFTLNGAAADRIAFATVFTSGQLIHYVADDGTQAEWGFGTLTTGTPNILARTTVRGNTANTTSLLNFTGTVTVYSEVDGSLLAIKETDGSLLLGTGNTDRVKTEANQSQAFTYVGTSGSFTNVGTSLIKYQIKSVVALARNMRLDFKALLQFDTGTYQPVVGDWGFATCGLELEDSAGNTLILVGDNATIVTPGNGKIVPSLVVSGLTVGATYTVLAGLQLLSSSNAGVKVRYDLSTLLVSMF